MINLTRNAGGQGFLRTGLSNRHWSWWRYDCCNIRSVDGPSRHTEKDSQCDVAPYWCVMHWLIAFKAWDERKNFAMDLRGSDSDIEQTLEVEHIFQRAIFRLSEFDYGAPLGDLGVLRPVRGSKFPKFSRIQRTDQIS